MDYIELIKSRLLLSSIISKKVKLTKKGANFVGLCPLHHERTPSFTINDNKGFYYCFGCGASGDVFEFVCKTEGLNFKEAVESLAQMTGVQLPEKRYSQDGSKDNNVTKVFDLAADWFIHKLHNNELALDYLRQRKISLDMIKKFKIGYAPNNGLKEYLSAQGIKDEVMLEVGLINKNGDYFRNRIMFPIWNMTGKIIAFGGRILDDKMQPKYLNSPESILFKKRGSIYSINFALNEIRKKQQVFIVEGYTDVIALFQAGITNVVAPLGTAISTWHIESLWNIAQEIFICMDGDNAGHTAALRVASLALPILEPGKLLKFVPLPSGYDPYDICNSYNYNPKEILSLLENKAKLHSEFLWDYEINSSTLITSSSAPEKYAMLENRLMHYINDIKNSSVKKYYKNFFYNKIRFLQTKQGVKSTKNFKMTKEECLYDKVPSLVEQEQNQTAILRIAIEFPEMLDDPILFEQFADFNMTNKDAYELQQHIIDIKSKITYKLSKEALIEEVMKSKVVKIAQYIMEKTKLLHSQLSNYESAKAIWYNIMLLRELNILREEALQARLSGNLGYQDSLTRQIESIEAKQREIQMNMIKKYNQSTIPL
ncbi:DNA primase [Candidatus Mesenet endosymbiont of Agriotes lineatus]|uniref:DNA primase n=1 Tax=Candidatus Mesenet endosymbiont of Agriotes lineatus TaxID=3077948 RepID=UPI0030D311A6